ncbi:PorT family protein [Ornithobacterium rhinotracheale]|uniref:outer membrane beta-barrel protein n=1 Tax=Ornithobacterium rhinotracheale TaxID=28251 RepID=UPI00129CD3AC|nr:outer membrane beta-barrel protein [Ornithobacterium rhinotracheale]MRI63578.1 PorT family protein [Ornithobacterium rhinotracheale]MRJ09106.1 PorT family protein [Ornithobacterium rhinotracheale]MRJ11457.1 PorT family protein [Ornithobacterium rhinotracheale]UOH78941.1 PorT family protein [Ornithobacterium rhinotracheale]
MRTKLFRSFALLLLIISGLSQAQQKNQIRFSYNFNIVDLSQFPPVSGGSSYSVKPKTNVEIQYLRKIANNFHIATGVNYIGNEMVTEYDEIPGITEPSPNKTENFHLLSIPVFVHYNFLNYFFVSGGPLFDVQLNKTKKANKQSGIGLGASAGLEYPYSNFIFSLSPALKFHNLTKDEGLLDFSIQAGVGYKF